MECSKYDDSVSHIFTTPSLVEVEHITITPSEGNRGTPTDTAAGSPTKVVVGRKETATNERNKGAQVNISSRRSVSQN